MDKLLLFMLLFVSLIEDESNNIILTLGQLAYYSN